MGHHHEIPVRYGEVDLQRVVFNAHYLAYLDDAMDHWMRSLDADFETLGLGLHAQAGRARMGRAGRAGRRRSRSTRTVARWGTHIVRRRTIGVHVGERPVCAAGITYVGVEPGTNRPVAAARAVRRHLGEPADS